MTHSFPIRGLSFLFLPALSFLSARCASRGMSHFSLNILREHQVGWSSFRLTTGHFSVIENISEEPEEKPDNRLDEFIFGDTRQLVLNFDVETYTDVMQRLEAIRKNRGLESNVAVFLTLLVEYEESVKLAMKALPTR